MSRWKHIHSQEHARGVALVEFAAVLVLLLLLLMGAVDVSGVIGQKGRAVRALHYGVRRALADEASVTPFQQLNEPLACGDVLSAGPAGGLIGHAAYYTCDFLHESGGIVSQWGVRGTLASPLTLDGSVQRQVLTMTLSRAAAGSFFGDLDFTDVRPAAQLVVLLR